MNLAYFLPLGGSLDSLRRTGQDKRFLEGELSYYLQKFEKIYIFDYSKIKYETNNSRIIQIYNSSNLHRYIYAFIFPLTHRKIIKSCATLRVSHVTGMVAGILTKFLFKKNVVFNYAYNYSDFAWKEKKYIRSILLRVLSFISFYIADGIIVASKNHIDALAHRYKNKTIWIPNGVDINKFVGDDFNIVPSTSKTISGTEIEFCPYNILFIGRLTHQKNIINLVEAVNILNNKNIKLTVIGKGDLENKIKQKCVDYKISLELISKIDNEQLPIFYHSCDLFVLPSFVEGSSKVLLEAMSCECLCLVSNIPENTEIIKDGINGYVCGFSASEIAGRIKHIMSGGDRLKISTNARTTIEENYSMDMVMKKEVDFLC